MKLNIHLTKVSKSTIKIGDLRECCNIEDSYKGLLYEIIDILENNYYLKVRLVESHKYINWTKETISQDKLIARMNK